METSSLNQAHRLERKAEFLLKYQKFAEAVACYQKTADLLVEAMKLSSAEKALESLKLQHDNNLRKLAVIRHKQAVYERFGAMSHPCDKFGCVPSVGAPLSATVKPYQIQDAIYRNFDENDSLLRDLTIVPLRDATATMSATKAPKGDKTIIEELRVNNAELRKLVDELLTQLDSQAKENARLRSKVDRLQRELRRLDDGARFDDDAKGTESPFVILPAGGDLSPVASSRMLPNLPPLEMPNFDFDDMLSVPKS